MGHSFIDHTADVAADLDGASLGELFASGAQALTDTITDLATVRPLVTTAVTLEAPTVEDLLVDWLNELLYRFEARNMLPREASVTIAERDARWHLDATVTGEPFDTVRHPYRVAVKSATYHGVNITHREGTWTTRVVFDI
jgi:SHS2 domain-containing protein